MFRVELLGPVRHGISSMKGYMFVGERVVAEATFTAQIVKKQVIIRLYYHESNKPISLCSSRGETW